MTNREHLEWMKQLDDSNENDCDAEYRQAKALEIIAENLITINENLTVVGNELTAIKNLVG